MGSFNTGFNGASARYNRRTAEASAATARAIGAMASAARHRELRDRGLITERSTPNQIAAVEHRLAAQTRGRRELEGDVDARAPYSAVLGAAALAATVFATIANSAGIPGGAVFPVFVVTALVVCAIGIPAVNRREQRRADTIARADWDGDTCLWCGSSDEHLVDGEPEHPRVAHAVEVEAAIGGH